MNINIVNILFLGVFLKNSFEWETLCDVEGKCSVSIEGVEPYFISPGKIPPFSCKGNFTKKWNKTKKTLEISGQIDGISKYKPLSGKRGYECSGGLGECLNSCCLDGFCVAILYYCHNQADIVKLIYITTAAFFIFLTCFYWGTFFVLGCNFNKKFKNENRELQDYGAALMNKDMSKKGYNNCQSEKIIDEEDSIVYSNEKITNGKSLSSKELTKLKIINITEKPNDKDNNDIVLNNTEIINTTRINNTNNSNLDEDNGFLSHYGPNNPKSKSELPKQYILEKDIN